MASSTFILFKVKLNLNAYFKFYFYRFGATLARIESQKQNAFISKILIKPLNSASVIGKLDFWIGINLSLLKNIL